MVKAQVDQPGRARVAGTRKQTRQLLIVDVDQPRGKRKTAQVSYFEKEKMAMEAMHKNAASFHQGGWLIPVEERERIKKPKRVVKVLSVVASKTKTPTKTKKVLAVADVKTDKKRGKVAEGVEKGVKRKADKGSSKGERGGTSSRSSSSNSQRKPSHTTLLTKEALAAREGKDKKDRMYLSSKKWEGNSDDEGSVDSGCLDEDICFSCGLSTTDIPKEEWEEKLLLCDRCDSEFHISKQCCGIEKKPRKGKNWVCQRCINDEEVFAPLTYEIRPMHGKIGFPAHLLKKTQKPEYGFTPSRPLDLAWEECQRKGFMCVSKVFNYEVMHRLTHGKVEKVIGTQRGAARIAETWEGALREIEKRLGAGSCHNLVDRDGRLDLRLPDYVVEQLKLNDLIEPILEKLRTIMGLPKPEIRTHNVVFAPIDSASQEWHADDQLRETKHFRYFTILIPLNLIDNKCGGTEIWSRKLKRGDLICARPGDAFVFNGALWHRGRGNSGYMHRLFYYCAFACRQDENVNV